MADPAIVRLSQSVAARPAAAPQATVARNSDRPVRRWAPPPVVESETAYDEVAGAAAAPAPAKQVRFVDSDQAFRTRL